MATSDRSSGYLDYLPAIFNDKDNPFVGRFLLAFERILTGLTPPDSQDPFPEPGLEEIVGRIHAFFDPGPGDDVPAEERTPEEFLPWLAGWVALSLREDWDEEAKRSFIARIVPLYRLRGSRQGLRQILKIYTKREVEILEFDSPPHFFQVRIWLADTAELQRQQKIARAIIDQEKPAHTFYALQFLFPTMQILNAPEGENKGVIVGRTTLLGTSFTASE